MDEIIELDGEGGETIKIKKIVVSTNAPVESYQVYDYSYRKWRAIRYEGFAEIYRRSNVQKRNVLIEKKGHGQKK